MTPDETRVLPRAAPSSACARRRKANLGDGVFPLPAYLECRRALRDRHATPMSRPARSRSCAGSNTGSACRARAQPRRQRRSAPRPAPSCYRRALAGGAQAPRPADRRDWRPGKRADLVVLDPAHPALLGRRRRHAARFLDLRRQRQPGARRHGRRPLGRARRRPPARGAGARRLPPRRRAALRVGLYRSGGAYCSPPLVHSALTPRSSCSGESLPRLRSKISP